MEIAEIKFEFHGVEHRHSDHSDHAVMRTSGYEGRSWLHVHAEICLLHFSLELKHGYFDMQDIQ